MKKQYIQPSIIVCVLTEGDFIAQSPTATYKMENGGSNDQTDAPLEAETKGSNLWDEMW